MRQTPARAALVALARLATQLPARKPRTLPPTVPLAAITVAAQQHLNKTPRAQKQSGRIIHAYLGRKPKVLDAIVPARHTVCSTAFIGHGVGRGAVNRRQAMDRRRTRLTSASSCVVQPTAGPAPMPSAHSYAHASRRAHPLRISITPRCGTEHVYMPRSGGPPAGLAGARI